MIKIIAGNKGSGKTKSIVQQANAAVNSEKGNIVFIEKDDRLKYDLNRDIRLVDASEYNITNYDKFVGFINGITAANYDITQIFIDGMFKGVNIDALKFESFITEMEDVVNRANVNITITVSIDPSLFLDTAKKYL